MQDTLIEIGSETDRCNVFLVLHGKDGQKRPVAHFTSRSDLVTWSTAHAKSYIDPERWSGLVIFTPGSSGSSSSRKVSAEDWNSGVRWDSFDY